MSDFCRHGLSLRQWQDQVGGWGDGAFPESSPQTVLAHLREEVNELSDEVAIVPIGLDSSAVSEEAADCFLLLLHLAHKYGFSLEDAAVSKMKINKARRWSSNAEPEGHFKHIEA